MGVLWYNRDMRFSTGNLSNKDEAGLRHAARVASVSGVRKYKLGAVVKKGGRTLGVGVNSYRTYSPNFRDTDDFPPREFWTEHAEIAALRSVNFQAEGTTLYIARVSSSGKYRMSLPCSRCMNAIKAAGVKRVVYTVANTIDMEED